MSLKDISIKRYYDSDEDDILQDFYIPALSEAKKYDRIAGFFSSSSLAVSAQGMEHFIKNEGKMRLIAGAVLNENDIEAIEKGIKNREKVISENFISDLDTITDKFQKNNVAALAWMIAHHKLEIKIAIVVHKNNTLLEKSSTRISGMFHQKIGLIYDKAENIISFSGSDNETAHGWQFNIEEFKVFKSWMNAEKDYLFSDQNKFEKFWNNQGNRIITIPLPKAIEEKLISIAPKNKENIKFERKQISNKNKSKRVLRNYQNDAVNAWLSGNKQGYFEMATGTGKTLTAIRAIVKFIEENNNLCIIISVPSNPLVVQWKEELIKEGIPEKFIECCSSDYKTWKKSFSRYCLMPARNIRFFIITYKSLYLDKIQDLINASANEFMLVCDEMHHAGAELFSKVLNKKIQYRLGLSATPIRAKDVEGSQKLLDYFGEKPLLKFDIERALKEVNPHTGKTYLCPYEYNFETVKLSDSEYKEYKELSKKIALKMANKKLDKEESHPDKKRALLISCASEKIGLLDTLVKHIIENKMHKKMLFYSQSFTSKDLGEKQINSVKRIINENNLNFLEFTSRFHDKNYRNEILSAIQTERIDAIVSIKCLDEGVDLPDIRTAVILSSSTNSAEFIQRRGRILRNSPGKEKAIIYDFLVGPPKNGDLKSSDLSLIKREYSRAKEYAKHSLNSKINNEKIIKWLNSYNLEEGELSD